MASRAAAFRSPPQRGPGADPGRANGKASLREDHRRRGSLSDLQRSRLRWMPTRPGRRCLRRARPETRRATERLMSGHCRYCGCQVEKIDCPTCQGDGWFAPLARGVPPYDYKARGLRVPTCPRCLGLERFFPWLCQTYEKLELEP